MDPSDDKRQPEVSLLVTVDEAAVLLSISRSAIYRLMKAGELQTVKIQKRRLVPRSAIHDFVSDLLEAS